ncbi:Cathepsin L1 [Tupaia chinensis]|uniref:Cathepsin L1 n=1 Tax=Tupaia chinensis TaxID=246437 RepID=L9K7Y4_TUPCH|nr:Cathepsin L1 [Tupaia chinensis]
MSPLLLLVILCVGVAAAAPTAPTSLDAQQHQETAIDESLYDMVGNAEGSVREVSEEDMKMMEQLVQKYIEKNRSNNLEMVSIPRSLVKGLISNGEKVARDLLKNLIPKMIHKFHHRHKSMPFWEKDHVTPEWNPSMKHTKCK